MNKKSLLNAILKLIILNHWIRSRNRQVIMQISNLWMIETSLNCVFDYYQLFSILKVNGFKS